MARRRAPARALWAVSLEESQKLCCDMALVDQFLGHQTRQVGVAGVAETLCNLGVCHGQCLCFWPACGQLGNCFGRSDEPEPRQAWVAVGDPQGVLVGPCSSHKSARLPGGKLRIDVKKNGRRALSAVSRYRLWHGLGDRGWSISVGEQGAAAE